MSKKKFIAWMTGAITSLIVAIAFPLLMSAPVTAQTPPPTPQVTTTVTSPSATASLRVYAAVSLLEALTDVENAYNNSTSTPKINFTNSLDSSGILLQNINYAPNETAGIPDVFISAATSQMTSLQTAEKLAAGWPQNIARNRLVLIKPNTPTAPAPTGNAISSFSTLVNSPPTRAGIRGIAIGSPSTVPAGEYARQVLTSTASGCGGGTYNTLLNNPLPNKLIFATNVRNVLSAVETKTLGGNVIDAGIVYATDKQVSTLVTQVGLAAPSTCLTTPIVYPEAVLNRTTNVTAANSFANFVATNTAARNALTNRGFLAP
ncbi:Molybdenum ABC transporter, periplasmic binding protein [Trichormus variabilis ATCC 29413]|uniref:Molybdenum ABC transporter, periplasmic binding protein n=2 Tax=Anabaena variabilis TaxID=264691 RepID=Q3M5S0_TRIV2|nr:MULTISPECIES: molybdate ABC transporter substrate-binding protein [Nostocaceae]ABA23666.1 Molybdenum ABC transporter, periplasmic binding protein [Trichormus variabilis ATCC 29413]MBC1216453.1 molybdate ABC transporter substrate-binding protein [Trichormus variabilis ARAD]MBC1256461.1 molybdate ABC transporter substrate-binding protein [Trichormus variabilis V5]MBC1266110.1 molybdate ABC transporter substrate-binding protein [Trichormus variabilis FSR]MBC1304731.1 molybdate ABC transporter 